MVIIIIRVVNLVGWVVKGILVWLGLGREVRVRVVRTRVGLGRWVKGGKHREEGTRWVAEVILAGWGTSVGIILGIWVGGRVHVVLSHRVGVRRRTARIAGGSGARC